MDDVTREVRAVSKALFGSAGRLDALVAINSFFKSFLAEEFAKQAGLSQSSAYQELARLQAVGLLTRSRRSETDRAYVYEAKYSILFTMVRMLRQEIVKDVAKRRSADAVAELTEMAAQLAGADAG